MMIVLFWYSGCMSTRWGRCKCTDVKVSVTSCAMYNYCKFNECDHGDSTDGWYGGCIGKHSCNSNLVTCLREELHHCYSTNMDLTAMTSLTPWELTSTWQAAGSSQRSEILVQPVDTSFHKLQSPLGGMATEAVWICIYQIHDVTCLVWCHLLLWWGAGEEGPMKRTN